MIFQTELTRSLIANGDHTAIEYGKKTITYRQLLTAANKITWHLQNLGLEKETVVGIQFMDKTDLICAVIGVLNARCVFAPIDGTLPAKRLSAMTADMGMNYLILSRQHAGSGSYDFPGVEKFYIEDWLEGDDRTPAYPAYEADDSIYIYFTSGSTGTPKGIIGRNCSLLQFIQWETREFAIGVGSRVSQFISPFFDAFLRDVFVPLLAGGTLCIPPAEDDFFTPEKMASWVDRNRINVIHCVPSLFRVLNSNSLSEELFTHLRYVFLSGEKIIPMELLDWYAVFNDRIQLVNFYGATETTMIRSFFRISPADARQVRIPIGEPIADTQLLIANTDGKPCKTFIPGDLYIISKYFTKGYLNAPDLNREKFITLNPGGPDEKLAFKTGDKARMLPGGIIDLIGREDRQVKLRGIRIELDEIENVFFQSGKVENAVVYKQVDENKNELLVAFVISRMDADADVAAGLQPYLEEHLPAYMIPSDIVVVPEFPLLSNGKINFRELLNSLTVTDIVAPVNDIETRLLALWKEIIGDRPISTEDSFHKAGGSSLGIMNLIGKIQKVYDVKITLSQLFSNPTIKKQALFIENAKQKDPLLIGKAEPKPAYNLSSGQTAVYQRLKDEKDSVSHHHNLVLKLNGPADEARIASALRSLISRHEVLRTEFVLSGGRLQQVIKDEVDFRLEPTKMTAQSVDEFIPQSEQPFELGRAPLMRAGLVVDSNGEQLLLVEIHPMVCDRHSLGGIVNDFLQLFEGQQLKMTELQYRDYSEWEQQFKTTTDYIACREFWLKPFDGEFTQVELPYSHTNDEAGEEQNGSVTFRMDKWRLGSIVDRLTKDGITIDAGLLSILFLHLSQLTGQKDLTAGVAVNGRFRSELNEVAGVFEKLLPLRCHIDEDQSFNELAATIHEYLQQAKTKQAYDMTDLVAELNRNRNSTITTLFDVVFDYNAAAANNQQIESDVFQPVEFGRTPKAFPLTLTVTEGDSSFSFRFEWIAACFSKTDIVLLVSQFKDLLTRLAEDPRAPVGETSLVTSN